MSEAKRAIIAPPWEIDNPASLAWQKMMEDATRQLQETPGYADFITDTVALGMRVRMDVHDEGAPIDGTRRFRVLLWRDFPMTGEA